MTTRSFASLAFKLLGTYMLVLSVGIALNLYYSPRKPMGFALGTYVITLLLPLVLAIAFGVVLITKNNLLAQWAVSTEGEVEEAIAAVKATQSLAFSVLGVAFFVFGVVRLVGVVTTFMIPRSDQSVMFRPVMTFPSFWPQLVVA